VLAPLAVALTLLCCASSSGTEGPPPTPPDLPEVIALPGYAATRVPTRDFPGQAYVIEVGAVTAPTVILIHGISRDGARDWDLLLPALAKTHRVLTFDLPGFGRSGRGYAPYGPMSYADFVDELIETRVQGPFDLVAHSMGVSIGLEVARRHPERVGRVVFADAAGLLHGQALSLEQLERGRDRLGWLGDLLAPVQHGAFDLMAKVPDRLVHRFAASMSGEAAAQSAARLLAYDAGPALDAVKAPTLVLWGSRDDVVSERGAWVLASRLRDARIAFLPEAAHVPMHDAPDVFSALVTAWLTGRDDVGRPLAPAAPEPGRDAECRRSGHRTEFTGAYGKLSLEGCSDVVLRGVRAVEIEIVDSTVVAEDTIVTGDQVAVSLHRSRLKWSGGGLSAAIPMRLAGSEVDLAGVTFEGLEASIEAIGNAKVLCSLCRLVRGDAVEGLHGFRALRPAERL
jgi:pimeloyl-ACP methyl ester carboxylesterase